MAEMEETYVVEIDPATLGEFESVAAEAADGTFYLYECGECGKRFTEEEFSTHTHDYTQGEEGVPTAPIVIRKPPRTIALQDLNEDNRAFQCAVCQKPFMQASNLKRHMRTHTGEKPFRCSICARQFTQGNNLKAHMRIHSGERPFGCSYCDQKFTQGSNLRKHERSHLQPGYKPVKRFGCAQCGCFFVDYSILKAHIRVHTKEKPFECTLCDARFSQESNLRRHHRIHTGERPFKCTECGKQFSQGNNLKAHMIVHTGEKPLTCPTCGARFSRASKYQQHYRDVHLSGTEAMETISTQYMDEQGNIITLDGGTMIDESGAVIKIISSSGSTATIIREGENGREEQVVEIVYESALDEEQEGEEDEAAVASISQPRTISQSHAELSTVGNVVAQGMDEEGQQYVILESVKQEVESEDEAEVGNEAEGNEGSGNEGKGGNETEEGNETDEGNEEDELNEEESLGNQGCDSFTVGAEEVSVAAVCEVGEEGSARVRVNNNNNRSVESRVNKRKPSLVSVLTPKGCFTDGRAGDDVDNMCVESRLSGQRSRKRPARSDYVYE